MAGSLSDEVLPPLTTEDKMLSGLCYPFWMAVPLFVLASPKREDPFLCFHALQGLGLGIGGTVLSVLSLPFLWLMFNSLPTTYTMTAGFIGVFLLIAALAWLAVSFAAVIFMGWQASSGRFLRLPWLGDLCEARVGKMLDVDAERLHEVTVDRELEREEKVTIIAPISTPEQLEAEVDQWAKPAQPSWWGGEKVPAAQAEAPRPQSPPVRPEQPARVQFPQANSAASEPVRAPAPPRLAGDGEVRPWRPAAATHPAPPVRPTEPEVKPWRPAAASATPQAKPVSFPSVARPAANEASRPTEESPKWWKPKE